MRECDRVGGKGGNGTALIEDHVSKMRTAQVISKLLTHDLTTLVSVC